MKTGALVFFNGYLLHRSRKNRGEVYRRCILVNGTYMNAWSHLPWSLKEGESPANADRRAIVPVAVASDTPTPGKGFEEPPSNVWLRTCKANTET